jgi:hypothetical protein
MVLVEWRKWKEGGKRGMNGTCTFSSKKTGKILSKDMDTI